MVSSDTTYRHADEVHGASLAADRIIPVVLGIVGPVESVVDVGGGTGAWLNTFRRHGVGRIMLVDHPSAGEHLLIDREDFRPCDLGREMPELPRFDLAVCVECAEHLPANRAEKLVACLAKASDLVVFSAALPYQLGKKHINCQPASYWKDLFAKYGLARHDVLRQPILHNEEIPYWYRQNLFLFARPGRLDDPPADFLPEGFVMMHEYCYPPKGLRRFVRHLPDPIATALRDLKAKWKPAGT